MSYSSRSSFRASSSSYKYSSDGGADGYSASSYKTSSRIGGIGSPSRLSETSASRISRLDDDGGITSTTSSSRRLLGRGDDTYESNITSSRLSGSQLYSRKDSDDDFISRRLSSTSSTSGHRAITSGAGEDGIMSSYASRRISRGLSGDLDLGGESTSYTASRRSVRASGLSSIDDEMTGDSMLSKRSRDYSEESSSSSRKYTRTYGIEDESEPIGISRSSRLSSRFSEEDSSMITGSTARRQYSSRLSSMGDDDLGTSSATRQYSRLSSLKDDDIPMLTGSSTRRQYSSRLSSMDEGDQSIGGSSTKRLSRLSSANEDEQTFSGSSSRRQYSRLSSTDENEPMLTGSSVRRQYSRLADDDQVLSSSSSSRRQFSRIGSAADDEPISSASTRQYSRLSSINDDDQILSGSSTRRSKYSSRYGSVNDEDEQILSSSSSARRQYSRLSSAEDDRSDQTYSSTRRQASRLGSSATNDDDLYSTTSGRRPLSRLSSHANDENIEASSKSYKRLDSQESSLSTIRRKSSLVSDEDSILSGSGQKRSLDKGDSIRSSSYRITSVDRDDDYSVPRSPKIRAKNSELDDESDLISYSKHRRDSTGETHSLKDTSDASQPRESWKEQVEKAKQLSRELEELASQDIGLPQPKKVKESEKEPRTPARIKVMRQETAEGIESIPVSPQVQEPPTSGEITPRDHPLQSSQISELTSEAVTRAGGLDDFRAYEEQDTVVTESLRSGSVTSIEEFASSEDDSLYSSANEVAGKPPFVRTASSKPVSRNDHSEHVDLLRPDSRPCTPGGSIVPHAPVFKVKLKDVQLLEASNVRFEMIARAMPLPTVTFYKDDKPLEQNDRVRVVFENKECFELIIDHVKPEDEGIYKAVATNPLGEDMTVGRLTTTKHKDVFRGLDDDFSFAECESTEISRADSRLGSAASASPAFRWFKDGHEFEASDRFQCSFDDQEDSIALLFQHVTPGDAGLYTCVANTCSGKISCSAELNVQGEVRKIREPEAPRIKASMNDVEVNEGASAMLEAKITGFPRPRIVWYKDNEKVVTDERHKFMYEDEESYTLVIKNVRTYDAARYRIVASSDLGEVETSGNLTVTTAPKIKRQLRDQCVMTDGPLRLDVGVEGNPPPEAQWFKDGKELKENERIKIVAEDDVRSLIIESAKLEDSGNYSCVVSNTCGQQTTQTVVKVNASPKFVTDLKDTSVTAGDTIEFKAKVTGEPKPEVEFLKDGRKITPDSRIKIEKEGDTHRLIIRKATEEDAGSYQCVAKNEHGSVESDAKLEVLMGPIFEESLRDKECNEDDKDIDMSVKIQAKPEAEVKWLYENKEIRMSETKNIIKESDGRYTLRMKSVTIEESGKYTVIASNSEGEARSSAVLTVTKSKEKLRKEEMLRRQMSEERKRKEEEERRKEEMKKDEVMEQDDEKKSLSRRASQMEQVKEEDEAEMEQYKASSRRESREKLNRQTSKIDEAEIDEKGKGSRRVSKDSGRDEDVTKKIDGDTSTDDMKRDDKDTSPKIDGDVSMDRRQSKDSRDKRILGNGDVDAEDQSDDQARKFKRRASGDSTTDSKLSKSGRSRDKVDGDGNIDGSSSDTKSRPKLRGDSSFDRHPKMLSQDSETMDESDKILGDKLKSATERRPSKTGDLDRRPSTSRPGLEDYQSKRKPSILDEKESLDDVLRKKSIEPKSEDDILDEHGIIIGRRRSSTVKSVDKARPGQKLDDKGKIRKLSTGTEPESKYGKPLSRDSSSSDQIEQVAEDIEFPKRRGSSIKPTDEAQKLDDKMQKSPSQSKFGSTDRKPSLSDAYDDRRAPSRSDSEDGVRNGHSKPRDNDHILEEQSEPFPKISRKPSISKVPEIDSRPDADRRPSLQRIPSDNVPDDQGRRKGSSSHPNDIISDRKPSVASSETDTERRPSFQRSPSDNLPDQEVRRKSSITQPDHISTDRKPSLVIPQTDSERRPSLQRTPSDKVSDERRKSSSSHSDHIPTDRKSSIGTSDIDSEHKPSLKRAPTDIVSDHGGRRKSSSSHPDHVPIDRKPSIVTPETDAGRKPSLQEAPSDNVPDEKGRRKSSSAYPHDISDERKPSIENSGTDTRRKPSLQRTPSDVVSIDGDRRKSSSTQPDQIQTDRKPSIGASEIDTERKSSFQRSPSDILPDERRKSASSHPDHGLSDRKPSIGDSETDIKRKPSLQRIPSNIVSNDGDRRKSSSTCPDQIPSDQKPSMGASEADTERSPSFRRSPSDNIPDERGKRKSSSSHPSDSKSDRKSSIATSENDERPKFDRSPSDHRRLSSLDTPEQTPERRFPQSTSPVNDRRAPIDQKDINGKQPEELDEGKTSRKPSLLSQDSLKSPTPSRRGSGLGQSGDLPLPTENGQSKPYDSSSPELRKSPINASDQGPTEDILKNDKTRRRSSFKPILEDVTDVPESKRPEYMRGQSSTIDNRGGDAFGPTISHPDDEKNDRLFSPRRFKDSGPQIEELEDDQPDEHPDENGPRGKVTEPEEMDGLPSKTLPDSSRINRNISRDDDTSPQKRKDSLTKQYEPRKDSLKPEDNLVSRDRSGSSLQPESDRRPSLRKGSSTDIPSDGDISRRKSGSSPTDSLRRVKPGSIPKDSRNDLVKPDSLDDKTDLKSRESVGEGHESSDDKPQSKDDSPGRRSSAVSVKDQKTLEELKSTQPSDNLAYRKPSLYDDKSQEIPDEDNFAGRRRSSASSHGPGDSIRASPKVNDKSGRKLSFAPEPEVQGDKIKRKPSLSDSLSSDQNRKTPETDDFSDSRRGSQSKSRPDDTDLYGLKPSEKRPSISKDNRLVDSRSPSASDLVGEEIPKDTLVGRRKRTEPKIDDDTQVKRESSISDKQDRGEPPKSDLTGRKRPSFSDNLNGKTPDENINEKRRSVDEPDRKPTTFDQKAENIRKPSLTPISEVDHPEDKQRSSLKNGSDRKALDSRRRGSGLESTLEAPRKTDSKTSLVESDHPELSKKSSKPQIEDTSPIRRSSTPKTVDDDGKIGRDRRRESDSKPGKSSYPEKPEDQSSIPPKIDEKFPTNRRQSQISDQDQKQPSPDSSNKKPYSSSRSNDDDSPISRKSTPKSGDSDRGIADKYPVDGRKDDSNKKPSKLDDDILSDQQTDRTSESHDDESEEAPPLKDRAPRPRMDSIFDAEERAKITGAEPADDDSKGRKMTADSDIGDKPVFEKGLVDREAMETDNNVEFDVKLKDTKPKPQIDWYVDDVLIMPNDRRYKMVPDEASCIYKLVIRRPDETMEGVYKCKASNEYGYDETSAKFTIIREPKFIKKLRDKDIDIHDKLILSVKVDGIPEPEITWFKDGEEVAASATITLKKESDGSHSLIIDKSQSKDEGIYKCVAINKLGKDETEAKITILSPPEFSKKLEDVTVLLGDAIVLEVKVSGADRVMWYKDGLKYCDAIAESDGTTYRLKLTSAKMDDAGEYRCVAWNSFGRVDSGIGKLTVKPLEDREPPKFTKPLQDVEVPGDTDARFDVQVTGSPKPKVSWLRDGIDLRESDRIIMKEEEDNSYSLTIKNTKQSDEAVYSCSASNEMGEAQDQASLTVKMAEKQEKPRITGLRDIETEIDSSVDFSAKVSGYPVPEVVWKKDGKSLKSDDNIRISRDTEDETLHHLRVKKVQESDTGTFTLKASNSAGEEEKSAQLTITIEQPHFTKQLRNITAKPSTDIILEAEVAGYPSPKITWYKDGKEVEESLNVTISQKDGICRLILKNISNDSAGLYTCKAENEAGTDETQATVTVSVGQESPRFTKPLHDETVDQGDEIVLEVEVKGSPPPLISWFKDGRRLSQSPKVSITQADGISKLVLKNANDDNAGLYTCKADNDTGQDETQANVSVNPPQEVPKFIRPLRDIAGQPGKSITLETEVTGFPAPKITWYQDGRRLSESSNVSISESDGICKLVLRNISDSSIGNFTCKAENPIGKDETTSKVSVQSPMKFIKSLPPKMDVPEGDSFRLEAQLSGPLDQAEIKWLKDGKEIPEDRRHRIAVDQDGNIALIVEDASPNDVGNYQVVVQTPTQKIHSDCHVSLIPKEIKKVPRDPKFLEELRPAKVEEGKPLKLEAKVSGFPKPNVSWYKDDEPLSPGPHHGFIYEPDGTVGLLLDHCTSDDAGVYKAVATNDSGDATTEAQVDVEKPKPPSSKPTFSCDMKPIDVKQGEPIFLQVKVDGNPPPSIKWLKDGDEIIPDGSHISIVTDPDGTTTLRIDHAMPEDSGKYTISVANDAGRNRTSVPVFVRRETKPVRKPEFDMPLVATTLKADEPGEISVKIVGEPKPEVKWFKNGEELVPDGRIHFEEKPSGTHSIVIDNVLPGDAGNYTCVIGNPAGEERSSAPVQVNQPPDFSKKLERSLSAIEGFPVKIETKVEGEPKPEITWSKDGETIIPDGDRIRIINEPDGLSSVVIQSARPSDKGTYGCTATNPLGTKKTEGDIDVKPKSKDSDGEAEPRFIQSISDNDVDEGKSMRFEGIIEGNPISDIKWFRNGEELTYGSNIIPSFDGRRACLEIRNSGPRDEGEYECRVSNKLGTASSKANGYVRPRCPPKFTQPLSDVSWSSRNPVTLSCRISGNPEPEIQWYYNGKLIQPSLKYRMKKDGDVLSLTVLDPRPTDGGSFECRAKNSLGMDSTKCNLRISDRVSKDEPAHFIKRFNDYECEEGRTAKFTACISGNPKPDLKWFKDGREFKPSSKHTIDVESNGIVRLTIKNVEPIDIGEYRLEISNSVGRDSSIAKLSLEEPRFKRREPLDTSSTKGPPGVPSGVLEKPKILRMWDTGVSLGWKPSVSHVPTQPVTYAVDWTRYPSEDWKTYRSGIRGTRCDIPGLAPGQDYSFRVSAMNKYGTSKPSPTLTAYRSKLYEPGDYKPKEYEIERPPTDKQACAPYWLRKEEDVMYGILRQPVTIEFWVYGYPEPNILWYYNDVEIKVGGGSKFDTLHDRNGKVCLFINRMTEQDVGVYTCKAWNEHGETVKKIRLLEAEPPMFTLRLKETTGMAYKSVRMECKVTGKPMPQVKWFKGWSPLYDSDRVKILWEDPDHSTMFMTSAITRDSGLYSVTATNFVGNASCSANLSIENDEILVNWANYVPRIVKPKRRAIEEHYDIGDEIGRGTQGVIYHAQERRSGDSYATKFMHGKGPMREFMQQELDAMNQLFHPKLLRLADAFDHKDTMCLVTDLCDGGDLLKSVLERGTLTEGEVANYIKQVLEGLNHMHCRDIGHLGLTIGDILVEHVNSDDIKIGDFGLSRRLAPGKPLFLRYGHPEFVAPEIVNNKEATLAADMWSVGIITYLLLTGISPFLGENDRETLTRLKEGQINFSHDAFAGVSGNARDFLTKLLVTEPTKRLDVKRALNHPWLQPESISSLTEQLPCINNLKDYREKWKAWHKNASCKKWYRRNPMETCFTDPSKMIYPPDQEYSPPDTPTGDHRPKFKASEFDPSVSARPGWETMDMRSESQYQSGPDTYLLPHRDVDFPLRIREYLRVGASRSPSLANNLRMSHWGDPNPYIGRRSSPQVSVRERRRFVEVMDEEIDDERKGLDNRRVPMRLQHEIGTPGYAYGQVHHLKQEAALNIGEKITVKAVPPYFREKIRDVIINESDEVIFTCYPIGDPKPTITWFRNDGIILESPRAQYKDLPTGRVQLHIQPSYAMDAGCYKCVARNDHGVAFCRARLKFGTKPERPDTPKVKDISSHEICLCWPPPKNSGNSWITSYSLEYQKRDDSTWKTVSDDITQEIYLVDSLDPETTYVFRLKAKNKFGWSEVSLETDPITTKSAQVHSRVTLPRTLSIVRASERKKPPEDIEQQSDVDYTLEREPIAMKNEDPHQMFTIGDEISRGRFSLILSASMKDTNERVALKVCLSDNQSSSGIMNEHDIMKSLCHQKIARLVAACNGSNLIALAMEPLSGIDVVTFLSRKYQYNEDTVTKIITQILDGIEYLNFRNICVLEIQPDNVVLVDDRLPHIKLVDFANARHVPVTGTRVSIQGQTEYLAPEILKKDEVFAATDIWCVGVLTYILLSGVSPFRGETEEETVENVTYVRYHFDHLYKEVTQEAIRFLMLVFKRSPSKRPTIDECLDHKWLIPNDYAVRKREKTLFSSSKLSQFTEANRSLKHSSTPGKLLTMFGIS